MSTGKKAWGNRRDSVRRALSVLAGALLIATTTTLAPATTHQQALAFGPQFSISPFTVSPGQPFTATLKGISGSNFCGSSPEGTGYYIDILLQNLEMELAVPVAGSPSETGIDPRTVGDVSITTRPVPDWFPLGTHLAVAYCRAPDGGWTSNNVPARDIQVVAAGTAPSQGSGTATTEPAEEPTVAPETLDEPAAAAETDIEPERSTRSSPMPAQTIGFTVKNSPESGKNQLYVEGVVPTWATEVKVYLVAGSTETVLLDLNINSGAFSQAVTVPGTTTTGTYLLRAESWRNCPPPRECRMTSEKTVTVTANSVDVLGYSVPRDATGSSSALAASLIGLSILGLVLAVAGFGLYRRASGGSATPSS